MNHLHSLAPNLYLVCVGVVIIAWIFGKRCQCSDVANGAQANLVRICHLMGGRAMSSTLN